MEMFEDKKLMHYKMCVIRVDGEKNETIQEELKNFKEESKTALIGFAFAPLFYYELGKELSDHSVELKMYCYL